MNGPRAAQVSKLPLVLLAIMTVASFGGPFGLGWIFLGGQERGWPPDRPIEWVAFVGMVGLVAGLMIALLAIGLTNLKAMKAEKDRLTGTGSATESPR